MKNDLIIGIDLGTTNTVVSVLDGLVPKTILVDGNKLLPSVVHSSNGTFSVGQIAKNIAILEPENTVLSIKRKIGQNITIKLGDKELKPEEISALILKKAKNTVLEHFEIEDKTLRAVVTVPAYFTDLQREATKRAAEIAGLKVERIINEPTAAALAFGLNKLEDKVFAIYDFGGGTFDISIIENRAGVLEVLSTNGDVNLGGDDIDSRLADSIWQKFIEKNKINPERTPKINARLIKIAEEIKIGLSTETEIETKENFFVKHNGKTYHLEITTTRSELENLINDMVLKTIELLNIAVGDANLELQNLEGIVLVGGSSKIPYIQQLIEEKTQIPPSLIDLPDEAVSHGATIQGAIINHIDIDTILVDITPHSLGIQVLDSFSDMFERRLVVSFLIDKNTPIPNKKNRLFSSAVPFQEAYRICVYQGESTNPEENKLIGECIFEVKEPVESGTIDVTYELDINGILNMSAVQVENGEKIEATFKSSKGKKVKQKEILNDIISLDEASKNLIDRAEKLQTKKGISAEDISELKNLIKNYKEHKIQPNENTERTENELMDLMYYLEEQ